MKFTESKDGRLRATLRITHRVGRDELYACIAFRASREDLGDQPVNPSRTWIENTTRDVLLREGKEAPYYWGDQLDDDDEKEITRWAEAAINGAFPELQDGER